MANPHILLVYPYPGIDTNPTITFLLESLARREVWVDVLAATGKDFLSPEPFGKTIRLEFLPHRLFFDRVSIRRLPFSIMRRLLEPENWRDNSIRFESIIFGLLEARRYSAVVGVDPDGITFAASLNRWAKKPLVYISFEILFRDEVSSAEELALKDMELAACEKTSLVLIQDEERAKVFCRETSIPEEKLVMVPVAPPPREIIRSDFLRKKLDIPVDKRIVLYCGNLEPWASRNELAEMVSYWPEKYCLVVHSRSKINARMEQYLRFLAEREKIFISTEPVTRVNMTTMIASAEFGLAPYKPIPDSWMTGKNLYHLGLSSGKISFYAMCGLPILARSLPVFEREFLRFKCGRVFRRLAETGRLLEEMDRDYDVHRAEARTFYNERLDPTDPMNRFCEQLLKLAC